MNVFPYIGEPVRSPEQKARVVAMEVLGIVEPVWKLDYKCGHCKRYYDQITDDNKQMKCTCGVMNKPYVLTPLWPGDEGYRCLSAS